MSFIDKLPYAPLMILALFLGLAPFTPEPHLVEKSRMLLQGELTRPLDIFDLCFHAAPLFLLTIKWGREKYRRKSSS